MVVAAAAAAATVPGGAGNVAVWRRIKRSPHQPAYTTTYIYSLVPINPLYSLFKNGPQLQLNLTWIRLS